MRTPSTFMMAIACSVVMAHSTTRAQWTANTESNTDVCRENEAQVQPLVVTDGSGGAIIVWQDGRNLPGKDIYGQHLNSYGLAQWENDGVAICLADSQQVPAGLVPDGAGGVFVVWLDRRSGNDDVYAQRIDGSGVGQWAPNGIRISGGIEDAEELAVTSDGTGGMLAAWTESHAGSQSDIYAQRVSPLGVLQWGPSGAVVCSVASDQSHPAIVATGGGGALVAWDDARNLPTSQDIYAQRLDPSGLIVWGPGSVPVCTASQDQELPQIVADGAAGAIIAWKDSRSGLDDDLYAQRLDGTGAILWAPDGNAVCTAPEDQTGVRMISNGSGGAILVWADARSASPAVDVYAQNLQGSGTPLWGADGFAVCVQAGSQDQAVLTDDGAGGVIIAWHDTRGGADEDVYAQRVLAAGSLQWTAAGVPVSTARDQQTVPSLTADGNGGVIVAWQDSRQASSRGFDIYAQNVNGDGTLGLPSPEWTIRYNNASVNKVDGMGFKIKTVAKLIARGLVVDKLGNSYVTGYSDGGTSKLDYLTIKYDLYGAVAWTARYDGTAGKIDKAYAIAESDGEVYVTGESQGVDTRSDIVTVKYSVAGAPLWTARYHYAPGGKREAGYAIAVAGGEDIVCVTGESDGGPGAKADMVTIAYDALTGTQLWAARYNGPSGLTDKGYALETFSLPGGLDRVVVTGESDGGSGSKADYATLLYNLPDGTPLWTARYNGPVSKKDYAYAVKFEKRSDLIYVTGASESTTKFDYATVQYDLTGTPNWIARYNNSAVNKSDLAYDLALGDNEELYVTGASEGSSKYDYATVKYLEDGTQVWVNRYDGGIGKKDIARSVAYDDQTERVLVTGSSEQGAGRKWDYLTIRINALTGLTDLTGRYNGPGAKDDHAHVVAVRPGGGSVVVTGSSVGLGTKVDYATMQAPIDSALPGPVVPLAIPDGEEEPEEEWMDDFDEDVVSGSAHLVGNYPNPFNPATTIAYRLPEGAVVRLAVFDLLGRQVEVLVNEEQEEGLQTIRWNAEKFASGVYFYRLEVGGDVSAATRVVETGKLLLMK